METCLRVWFATRQATDPWCLFNTTLFKKERYEPRSRDLKPILGCEIKSLSFCEVQTEVRVATSANQVLDTICRAHNGKTEWSWM